jgi:haloacetate dehalogenase
MFTGIEACQVELGDNSVRCRVAGGGPAVLLLHGFPQTHVMWHAIMPELARTYTVVAPDLRGYGGSSPFPLDAVEEYSKRAMAEDQIKLMELLGHDRFAVVGHDRGGRVGYRLALDHPERVTRLCVLDIVPGVEMWERAEKESSELQGKWHWNLFAQPEPRAERLMTPDHLFPGGSPSISDHEITLDPEALADYVAALEQPNVVHAMSQDYRAGATVDRAHDEADRVAGRTIRCPVQVLWGATSPLQQWFDPLAVWRRWAGDVRGEALDCGHFIAEEQPSVLLDKLRPFLRSTEELR